MTKVILNQDVPNLGEEGDVKQVSDGYARNYLIPQKLAMPYTKHFIDVFGQRKSSIEKRKEDKRQGARSLKEKIESEELTISMPAGDHGKLFGAVTSQTVAEALEKKGIAIERKRIEIPEHSLKMVGNYVVRIRLYEKEEAKLKVVVQKSEE